MISIIFGQIESILNVLNKEMQERGAAEQAAGADR
jgi:hypothetical protein